MADAAALPVASPAESAAAGGALPAAPPAAPRGVLTPAAAAADAPPPPLPPPPGFEAADAGSHKVEPELAADVAAITAAVTATKVGDAGDEVDEPDLSLKTGELNVEAEAVVEIKKELAPGASPYVSAKTFEELNLSEELLRGLYKEMCFSKPSRIQAETLPMILSNPPRGLIAQAHNGSGKTTCFVLGMLSRCDPKLHAPQALCMCPTRELVVQNVEVLRKMATHTGITCYHSATEGGRAGRAVASLQEKISDHVIISTPGTLNKWLQRKQLPLPHIKIVVFDEADHMWAYDGHQADSVQVLKTLAAAKVSVQVLLFSATFSEAVQRVAEKVVGPTANRVFVPRENLSLEVIKQFRVECASVAAKEEVLSEMILKSAEKLGQTIVFVHTRARATELHAKLHAKGWPCTSISGGPQHDHATRDRVIKEFRSGTTKILIATDVLSRGFDHASVTLVVNFDPPMSRDGKPEPEIYLHRIGRSGRFGRKGAAFNLVSTPQERAVVDAIAAHFKHDIPAVPSNDLDRFEEVLQQAGLA